MRSLAIMCLAALSTLMLPSIAQPVIGQQCQINIDPVEAVGAGVEPETIRVTGTAEGCQRVNVRLYCQASGGELAADVVNGRWEVEFAAEQARQAECSCIGRIAIDVTCEGNSMCENRVRQNLECTAPMFQHAATFICGRPQREEAAPGQYFSAINVHNPGETPILFQKKFAISLPEQASGPITPLIDGRLDADAAMEIDCPEIFERTRQSGFVKGYAVIKAQNALDVMVIYTVAGDDGSVRSMEIERVPARRQDSRR